MNDQSRPTQAAGAAVFFAYGFRPFFLLAGLFAATALPVWLAVFFGILPGPATLAPSVWHAHEMLYGYAGAAFAGFLLTAVPNWTATERRHGPVLVGLVALWLGGRVAMMIHGLLAPWIAALLDLAFLPALGAVLTGPLISSGNRRNYVFLVMIALLTGANGLIHAEATGLAPDSAARGGALALGLFLLSIAIVGGRIVPAFTRGGLKAAGSPGEVASWPAADVAGIAAVGVLTACEFAFGSGPVSGIAALAAGIANAARMRGWRTLATVNTPILWVLHLGFAWLAAGLVLKGLADLGANVPGAGGVHALTIGAVATMTLAVMTRAALGHTGRPLVAPPAVVAAYILISLAAVLRVGSTWMPPHLAVTLIVAAGAAWTLGFALYSAAYWPILTRPRVDGRPG